MISTIAVAGVVCEAWTLRLQERWLTLHLLPQRQDLPLIILQTLLIYIFQPKFLQQKNNTTSVIVLNLWQREGLISPTIKMQLTFQWRLTGNPRIS